MKTGYVLFTALPTWSIHTVDKGTVENMWGKQGGGRDDKMLTLSFINCKRMQINVDAAKKEIEDCQYCQGSNKSRISF